MERELTRAISMLALLDTPTRKLDMIMAVVDTAGILAGVAMESDDRETPNLR
jgi:hypothetical protein